MKNARFWVSIHGQPVKLTLEDGIRISHTTGGPNEEGYSYTTRTWRQFWDRVYFTVDTDARDCDGRMCTHTELQANLDHLKSGYFDEKSKIAYPDWNRRSYPHSYQRDYSAEAMGY